MTGPSGRFTRRASLCRTCAANDPDALPQFLTTLPTPLLWRLAIDVLAAHQPGQNGNCRNLQCAGQLGACAAARNARRVIELARSAVGASHARLLPRGPEVESRSFDGDAGREVGWFTPSTSVTSTRWLPDDILGTRTTQGHLWSHWERERVIALDGISRPDYSHSVNGRVSA